MTQGKSLKRELSPIDRHVGARVRTRRLTLGMNQTEFGTLLGVTYQQVQKYESGANRISASRLQQIAKAAGVSVEFFFDGLDLPERAPTAGELGATEFLSTSTGPLPCARFHADNGRQAQACHRRPGLWHRGCRLREGLGCRGPFPPAPEVRAFRCGGCGLVTVVEVDRDPSN